MVLMISVVVILKHTQEIYVMEKQMFFVMIIVNVV